MSTLQERLRAMQNKAAADAADRLDELEREVEALRADARTARVERNQMHERIVEWAAPLEKIIKRQRKELSRLNKAHGRVWRTLHEAYAEHCERRDAARSKT